MATASVTNSFTNGTTASATEVNTNFSDLVTFLNTNVVHVDGSKAMSAALPMGSNKITGLANGTVSTDAAAFGQLPAATVFKRTFWVPGNLVVGALTGRWYHYREAITIVGVLISCSTAPTGAAILVDVNKNGTTIYTTQGDRPTIAVSAFLDASAAVPAVTAFAATDYMEFEVDVIGSTIAGADMLIEVAYTVD